MYNAIWRGRSTTNLPFRPKQNSKHVTIFTHVFQKEQQDKLCTTETLSVLKE
jgi:hypothetical protein